jgi:hypothetical protein
MWSARHKGRRTEWRSAIAWLTLASHLLVTLGMPLPVSSRVRKDTSVPFPCQDHACGCVSARHCWSGDCCCMTLEEKLAWARANRVSTPLELVSVSNADWHATSPEKGCCSRSASLATRCCKQGRSRASSDCHKSSSAHDCGAAAETDTDRVSAGVNEDGNCSDCCNEKTSQRGLVNVYFALGISAQKCHGSTAWLLGKGFPFVFIIEQAPTIFAHGLCLGVMPTTSHQLVSVFYPPPTPPPRSF